MKSIHFTLSEDLKVNFITFRGTDQQTISYLPTFEELLKHDILPEVGDWIALPELDDEPLTITSILFTFDVSGRLCNVRVHAKF